METPLSGLIKTHVDNISKEIDITSLDDNTIPNNIEVSIEHTTSLWQEIGKKMAFIKDRDENSKNNTDDNRSIDFILNPNGNNELPELNEDEDIPKECVLLYETFVNNNMSVDGLGLIGADDVVLQSSYCNILFNYPVNCRENIVFTIHADNDTVGFTKKELALKAMQKYHLMLYLYKNYDVEKGKIVSDELAKERKTTIFSPSRYDDEWTDNGLLNLIYCKEMDQWIFNCYDYI